MASVDSDEERLPIGSTTWVGCTNVTDRQTDRQTCRQTEDRGQTTDGIATAKTRT